MGNKNGSGRTPWDSRMLFMSRFFILFSTYFLIFPIDSRSSEDNLYSFSWLDKDKEVYVLQNRKYRKKRSFYVSGGAGITTSGAFTNAYSFPLNAGYFFQEEWGIDLSFTKNMGQENSTAELVKNPSGSSGSVPFRVFIKNYIGAQLYWSPFYSKINTFNKIVYLDWMFGIGGAYVSESNNRNIVNSYDVGKRSVTDDSLDVSDSHFGLIWSTGLQFYLSKDYYLKLGLTAIHFNTKTSASGSETTLYNNYDLTLGLGYIF